MMGNYHARCGAGEKPEVETPEAYLSLFGQIPKFEKLIATIRSREISASIILQSKSQLKAIYKDNADTIEGNCDTTLFLGGKEKTTLKEIAEILGKETIDLYNTSDTRGSQRSYGMNYQKTGKELMSQDEIAVMDGGKCILQVRGVSIFIDFSTFSKTSCINNYIMLTICIKFSVNRIRCSSWHVRYNNTIIMKQSISQ